jgi:peptide/nickel transport system permease protein
MAALDHAAELDKAGANVSGARSAAWHLIRRYPLGAVGALIVLLFVALAVFAGVITSFDPLTTNSKAALAPPGGEHLLGADFMGRDMFARIVYGARISLMVSVGATALGCLGGVIIGLSSGFMAAGSISSRSASSTSCSRCRCW